MIQNVYKTICYQRRQRLSALTTLAKKNVIGETQYVKQQTSLLGAMY